MSWNDRKFFIIFIVFIVVPLDDNMKTVFQQQQTLIHIKKKKV